MNHERIGPYELEARLGEGGMAETFVAVRRGPAGFEQRVCLKRILPSCSSDPSFVTLFQDEARLIARLQCSQIVQLYDFDCVDEGYYMALELVEGLDLAALLRALSEQGLTLAPAHALYVASEVLTALAHAHSQTLDGEPLHIVHRDVSPSNVLLSTRGEVKLTDFGIAQARDRAHKTQAGQIKGKLAYMSPEQIRAEPLDGRSDLFSLGLVLFELLTGTHPFDAESGTAIMWSIVSGRRKELRRLRAGLPSAVYGLVDALLATDREGRPESAEAALRMLPSWGTAFVAQQELADLVSRCRAGRRDLATSPAGVARTRPLADPTDPQVPVRAADSMQRVADGPALELDGTASFHVVAQGSVAPRRRHRPGLARRLVGWTVSAVLILGTVLGARLWWARGEPALLRSEPAALPAIPPTALSRGGTAAPGQAGSRSASAQSLSEVVSPAKSGEPAVLGTLSEVVTPSKGRERAAPAALLEVVTPAKRDDANGAGSLREVTSPEKSGRSTAKAAPLADVISPPKSASDRSRGATP